jgi:type I restriction enzyme S subunit
MQSRSFQEALWLDIGFSAQPGIYLGTLANLPIALPPVAEQKEIAAYVTQKTESIAALRSKVEQAITKLRERRTALISAAVTGQIDVRSL